MGWYERTIFNRLIEMSLNNPGVREARAQTLAPARGDVLEIGLGTGMSLPHYPRNIRRVASVSPDPAVDRRAQARAEQRGIEIEHTQGDGAGLPFDAGSFDTVVSAFVLCTIPDLDGALRECARVLKPDGQLLFLEHVVARRKFGRGMQRVCEPVMKRINCGCSLVRDIKPAIEAVGFTFTELSDARLPAMPPLYRRVIRGVASPPATAC